MKLILLVLVSFFLIHPIFAQVGIGTNTPHSSSIVDVESENKGFLLPRLASDADVVAPALGLMIYDLSDKCINVFIGNNTWKNLCEGSGGGGIITTPPTHTEGNLQVSMKLCYDIAFSNDLEDGCGSLATRDLIKSDFTQTSSNTQTLTITTDVDISELNVVAVDGSGNVIQNVNQPASTNLMAGNTTTTTIEFKPSLNTDAQGLDFSSSLKAEVYVTYKDNNNDDRQRKINLRVQDCNCGSFSQEQGSTGVFADADGSIYTYGHNYLGAAGVPSPTLSTAFNSVKPIMSKLTLPTINGSEAKLVQFNSGDDMTLGVTADGKVIAWGGGNSGKLGSGTNANHPTPIQIDASRGFPNTEIAIGAYGGLNHTIIHTASNKLYGAGQNFEGELGLGHNSVVSTYTEINLDNAFVKGQNGNVVPVPTRIFVTNHTTFFVDADGNLWGAGINEHGQLGVGSTSDVNNFTKITAGLPAGNIVNVSATLLHTLVHMDNGMLYIAGDVTPQIKSTDPSLQADSDKMTTFVPLDLNGADISTETGNIVMATFGDHGNDCKVWIYYDTGNLYVKGGAAGSGKLGIVGNPGFVDEFKSVDLTALNGERIVKIKTYNSWTVLLTETGRIYCTGANNYGMLLKDPFVSGFTSETFIAPEQTLAKTTIFVN
ncbi:MAG: RCC1 domain-containing protein [Flavobacteriales bacterium]